MRRLLVTFAVSAMLVAACSSSSSSDETAAAAVTKESFCAGVAAVMGESDLPEPSPDLSKEEVDKAIAEIDKSVAAVQGGVELGAITADQLNILNGMAAMFKASYTDPGIMDGTSMPTPQDLGLTDEQYKLIFSADGIEKIDAVGSSMQDYCKSE